jgi:hypothetical protein
MLQCRSVATARRPPARCRRPGACRRSGPRRHPRCSTWVKIWGSQCACCNTISGVLHCSLITGRSTRRHTILLLVAKEHNMTFGMRAGFGAAAGAEHSGAGPPVESRPPSGHARRRSSHGSGWRQGGSSTRAGAEGEPEPAGQPGAVHWLLPRWLRTLLHAKSCRNGPTDRRESDLAV